MKIVSETNLCLSRNSLALKVVFSYSNNKDTFYLQNLVSSTDSNFNNCFFTCRAVNTFFAEKICGTKDYLRNDTGEITFQPGEEVVIKFKTSRYYVSAYRGLWFKLFTGKK